ncbi:hypothetical protein TNCV_3221041 [Trichonephila clavipes]|nr:hypothetical protein TNCV_3221041 [Trichonephila clavipes]
MLSFCAPYTTLNCAADGQFSKECSAQDGGTIYRSSIAVVFLGRPPPTFLTAIPRVWKAFQRHFCWFRTLQLLLSSYAPPPAFRSFH